MVNIKITDYETIINYKVSRINQHIYYLLFIRLYNGNKRFIPFQGVFNPSNSMSYNWVMFVFVQRVNTCYIRT